MAVLPVSRMGSHFEKITALLDAKWMIDERGALITYYKRNESDVSRDRYYSIKKKGAVTATTMYSFPITFNPTDKELMKAGLRENVDVMIYTAMQDWIDEDIIPKTEIDSTRDTINLMSESYQIKEIGFSNHFLDTFLNVTFGLVQR